jgi:hypothetical protein
MSTEMIKLNTSQDLANQISKDSSTPQQSQDIKPESVIPISKNLVDDMHKEVVLESMTSQDTNVQNQSIKSFFDPNRLISDVRYRNNVLSASNAFLHGLATVTNFIAKDNPALKVINHVVDRSAFFCTRWLTPYISYGHAVFTAFGKQKEPILGLIKAIPPAFFPIVGDANIDMVYGTSTACNQPYDNLMNRIKERIAASDDYAKEVQEARKSPLAFSGLVFKELKSFIGDFVHGKSDFWKEGIFIINCAMMFAGSIPMLLFGRDQRDTTLAKVSGVLRNVGGTLGDVGWVFGGKVEKEKVIMGIVYTLAQMADIAKRFVSEDVSKVLIHLSAALNVSAMTVWNTLNTENNKKTIDDIVSDKLNRSSKARDNSPHKMEQASMQLAA